MLVCYWFSLTCKRRHLFRRSVQEPLTLVFDDVGDGDGGTAAEKQKEVDSLSPVTVPETDFLEEVEPPFASGNNSYCMLQVITLLMIYVLVITTH